MTFKDITKLHQKKYRRLFQCFLAEGEHLILELEKAADHYTDLRTSEIYVTGDYQNWKGSFKKNVITEKQMFRISQTKSPQGIIARVPFFPTTAQLHRNPSDTHHHPQRSIYLHEVRDPGNLGAILRSLAWFGNFRCLLSPGSVDPYHAKVVRSSMGSIFRIPIEMDVPLDSLAGRFHKIACLDLEGRPLTDSLFKECDCYFFGNEARGVPRDQIDSLHPLRFSIYGGGDIESLNLAAAVNMSAYELSRAE